MKTINSLCALALLGCVNAVAEPSLTIYNADFAVVRDSVPLDLKAGENDVRFSGATARLEPDSVTLRDPAGKAAFQILEQSYRNDPVSQELLLSLFEGKAIEFLYKQPQKPDEIVSGRIVRSGYRAGEIGQPVVEVDGKLRFSLPGIPLFPGLGDDTILEPTLAWKIRAEKAAKFEAEVAYLTGGLSWKADYNLVAPEKGDTLELAGWVTFQNQSGRRFEEARIKLMAGDVNRVQPPERFNRARGMALAMAAPAEDPAVTEKSFDEFHLYTISRPATLRDGETKQVEFVRAPGVESGRVYVYDGALLGGWRSGMAYGAGDGYGAECNKKVNVYLEFKNTKENNLGVALPKGRLRVYRRDTGGGLEFVGENEIDHTPKDEMIRVLLSNAFDLVGERVRTNFKVNNANRWADEAFEIKVRNRKKEPVEIRVVEHLFRWVNWSVTAKSHEFTKKDAQTIEFRVPLKPDEEQTLTYSVHYTW